MSPPPLFAATTGLQEGDHPIDGFSITCGPLLSATEAIGPLKNGPITIRPSPSHSPPHRAIKVSSKRSSDPRKSQDGRSAPDLHLSLRMSTPWSTLRRGPLKRLLSDKSRDALMSMTTSCMRSITILSIFKEIARIRSSSALIPPLSCHIMGNRS